MVRLYALGFCACYAHESTKKSKTSIKQENIYYIPRIYSSPLYENNNNNNLQLHIPTAFTYVCHTHFDTLKCPTVNGVDVLDDQKIGQRNENSTYRDVKNKV